MPNHLEALAVHRDVPVLSFGTEEEREGDVLRMYAITRGIYALMLYSPTRRYKATSTCSNFL
jgi:hypothetical protein